MDILIITPVESRERYKFLSIPLERSGHSVTLIKVAPIYYYLFDLFKLLFSSQKPDFIIIISIGVTTVPIYLVSKLRGIQILLRLGGDPVRDKKSEAILDLKHARYAPWLKTQLNLISINMLLGKINGFIVVSRSLGKKILKRINKQKPIYVVPQFCKGGVVNHEYKCDSTLDLLTVSNLGYIDKALGVNWLIDQLIRFSNNDKRKIIFRVVGSGACLPDIEDYINNAHIPDNLSVMLEGYKSDLHEYYSNADVFLYRSVHDELPNVLLESKRYGLPTLANDCDEFREVINHEVSGVLYKDSDGFNFHLNQVVNVIGIGQGLGKNANKEFEEKYSIDAVKKILEDSLLDHYSCCF